MGYLPPNHFSSWPIQQTGAFKIVDSPLRLPAREIGGAGHFRPSIVVRRKREVFALPSVRAESTIVSNPASVVEPRVVRYKMILNQEMAPPIARYLVRHPWALPRFLNRPPPVSGD